MTQKQGECRLMCYPPSNKPGRGGGRPKEQGVPRPGPGTGFRRVGPGGDAPPPREKAEHSPCRVRKSRPESMPDGRRGGRGAPRDTRPRRQRGGLGSERSVVEGPEWTAGGRRPEVGPGLRSAPRPPAPPPPGPSNPRLSPPLLGFGWEDRGGGLLHSPLVTADSPAKVWAPTSSTRNE